MKRFTLLLAALLLAVPLLGCEDQGGGTSSPGPAATPTPGTGADAKAKPGPVNPANPAAKPDR